MLRDNELQDILLSAKNAQSACDSMIEQANDHGGIDNITVVILRVL
jgi:serine/threonine protein phosphatase PrpC